MRPKLLTAVLASLALLTGCVSKPAEPVIQYVQAKPECELPPLPAWPVVQWDDLLLPFHHIPSNNPDYRTYDDALTSLEEYEATLVDSLGEHREKLRVVCGAESARRETPDNQ